jgi:isocitrate dehydrogenase
MILTMMSNRGVKIWPGGHPETFCTDNYRCRFAAPGVVSQAHIIGLLGRIADTGMEIVKTENLRNYDGKPGYTLAQGE